MKNYEYRFEVKPGRYVYIPTEEARVLGANIQRQVLGRWKPASIFYHLRRRGGHVVAMKRHLRHRYFAKRDISHFYGSVTRTKVVRALCDIGFDNTTAFEIATASVVSAEIGKHVPYGFVQSPVLATLALEKSALAAFILQETPAEIEVTIFADDIMMSCDSDRLLIAYGADLDASAAEARFAFGDAKVELCELTVETFNCLVRHQHMEITAVRMEQFAEHMKVASPLGQEAVLRYVGVINAEQAKKLALEQSQ